MVHSPLLCCADQAGSIEEKSREKSWRFEMPINTSGLHL
jgi:hypothetical protein